MFLFALFKSFQSFCFVSISLVLFFCFFFSIDFFVDTNVFIVSQIYIICLVSTNRNFCLNKAEKLFCQVM